MAVTENNMLLTLLKKIFKNLDHIVQCVLSFTWVWCFHQAVNQFVYLQVGITQHFNIDPVSLYY